jgi:hypothetical protein
VATALTLHVTLAAGSDGVNLDEEISAVLRRVQGSAFSVLSRRKSAISNGTFTARFSVMKDGSLAPKSVKEAGDAVDGATRDDLLKSIRDAGPFPPLPVEFDRKSIEMQVVYTLGKSGTPMGAGATAVDIGVDAPSYAHDPIFANYLQRMVGTVKSSFVSVASKYAYAGDQFFVEIQFTINRNGSLDADSVHVVRTTADAAAAKALEDLLAGVKFEPLPANFKRDSVTVKFGFYVNTKPPAYMNAPAPAK